MNELTPPVQEESLTAITAPRPINWRQVGAFLSLTFGLTWLLDLWIWSMRGYQGHPMLGVLLQLQMLLPAFSAILLGMFFFKESAIHIMQPVGKPRVFFYFYLFYTLAFLAAGLVGVLMPGNATLVSAGLQILTLAGLLLVLILRWASGREAFARVGLSGGRIKYWILFGVGFVLYYLLQTWLNTLFKLGQPVDLLAVMTSLVPAGNAQVLQRVKDAPLAFLLITGFQTAVLSPLIVLLISFGEEYGWRRYLQDELTKLGRVKGILLLGIIWGIWHAPVILMGHNYPGYPLEGVFMMIAYCIGLGFALGYAMLKSKSVWLAAFLHGVNNQVFSFLVLMVYAPNHPILSFGAGIYSLVCMAVVVGLILLDPVWRHG